MGYPQTSVPETLHSAFYAYSITINSVPIGSFERFSARSSRTTERIREVLFTRGPETSEIIWGGTDTSIDLSYVELYQTAIFEAMGQFIFALEDFNTPVTIVEVMSLPASVGGTRSIEYVDAVASAWGKEIDSSGTKVVETMTFEVRKVKGNRL